MAAVKHPMTETEFLALAANILHPKRPMPILFEDVLDRLREAADPEEVAELEKRVDRLEEECAQAEDERDEAQGRADRAPDRAADLGDLLERVQAVVKDFSL